MRRLLAPALALTLVFFGAQSAPARNAALQSAASLIGHWTFDEGAGTTAADSSGGAIR
jgi:hypothetical protein